MTRLVLITGTGRSGTSTMSGTLHHLGLTVPGPFLGANDSNPKGFFESKWAVRFHKRIIKAAGLHDMDGRPDAFESAQSQIRPADRRKLVEFLGKHAAGVDQVVVKDPRSVWAQQLWKGAAEDAGLNIVFITMLRHPAEVIGSRATYYASSLEARQRRSYEIFNLVRWINHSLLSERQTRGESRAFVRYTDMLDDWRPVLSGLREGLGLSYAVDIAQDHTAVNDFIDPDLRRLRVTWDDLDVPESVRTLADEIWTALNTLADHGGDDAGASTRLDACQARFEELFDDAASIAHDAVQEARIEGRRLGAAEARAEIEAEMRAEAAAAERRDGLDGFGGRELLSALMSRVTRRVRRRPGG